MKRASTNKRPNTRAFTKARRTIDMLVSDVITSFYSVQTLRNLRCVSKPFQKLRIASRGFPNIFMSIKESHLFKFDCDGIRIVNMKNLHLAKNIPKNMCVTPYIELGNVPRTFDNVSYLLFYGVTHMLTYCSLGNLVRHFPQTEILHIVESSHILTQLAKTFITTAFLNPVCECETLEKCHSLILQRSPLSNILTLPNLKYLHCFLPWHQLYISLKNIKKSTLLKHVCFFEMFDAIDPMNDDMFVMLEIESVLYIPSPAAFEQKRQQKLQSLFPNAIIKVSYQRAKYDAMIKDFPQKMPSAFSTMSFFWTDNY